MNKRPTLRISVLMVTIVLGSSACSNRFYNPEEARALETKLITINEREEALNAKQQQLESLEKELQSQSAKLAATPLLPPSASAGECYTRIWEPDKYKTVERQVLSKEASERIELTLATYKTVEKEVLVEEASTKLVVVPATYATVNERVLIKPSSFKTVIVPAVYENVQETILNKPAHTTWKKGFGAIQRLDETTGEIMCLVDVPASYKQVTRRVVKTPATTKRIEQPAIYKNIKKTIVATPATTKVIEIPAKYRTVSTTVIDTPTQEHVISLPEEYITVSNKELVSKGQMQWRSILCETNSTPDRIKAIQEALLLSGYSPGPIDGVIGIETMQAINKYQEDNDLPVDNFLNIETVKSLGVTTH